jgi:hypothetical protein
VEFAPNAQATRQRHRRSGKLKNFSTAEDQAGQAAFETRSGFRYAKMGDSRPPFDPHRLFVSRKNGARAEFLDALKRPRRGSANRKEMVGMPRRRRPTFAAEQPPLSERRRFQRLKFGRRQSVSLQLERRRPGDLWENEVSILGRHRMDAVVISGSRP